MCRCHRPALGGDGTRRGRHGTRRGRDLRQPSGAGDDIFDESGSFDQCQGNPQQQGVYWMNAMREVTAGAVDASEQPGVISAITKCWETEAARRVLDDAMDIAGGAGICKGPRNVLVAAHEAAPIGITVEGANILTRSLIVFGQGAIRCHPWALREMRAAQADDLDALDTALAGHVNFALRNATRAFLLETEYEQIEHASPRVC